MPTHEPGPVSGDGETPHVDCGTRKRRDCSRTESLKRSCIPDDPRGTRIASSAGAQSLAGRAPRLWVARHVDAVHVSTIIVRRKDGHPSSVLCLFCKLEPKMPLSAQALTSAPENPASDALGTSACANTSTARSTAWPPRRSAAPWPCPARACGRGDPCRTYRR